MNSEEKRTGIINNKFKPCPKTPNCVSTMASNDDKKHYISPISYISSQEEAVEKIIQIINSLKGTKIKVKEINYIHVIFSTKLLRFKDDVEFYFDDSSKIIHFKSASRIGSSDLGTNRKRMEKIRKLYSR
ncbi:MAG: DUF1499 domain-containing protein [Promethearchaeota archaeon]